MSVICIDPVDRSFSDEEWDDEFLRIDGPELLRMPLKYASELQMGIKVGRIAKELQEPGSGLITPIEVERFSNGVRILFRPKARSYLSSKEEKKNAEAEEQTKAVNVKARGGYMRPEDMDDGNPESVQKKVVKSKQNNKTEMEGGWRLSWTASHTKGFGSGELIWVQTPSSRRKVRPLFSRPCKEAYGILRASTKR